MDLLTAFRGRFPTERFDARDNLLFVNGEDSKVCWDKAVEFFGSLQDYREQQQWLDANFDLVGSFIASRGGNATRHRRPIGDKRS